jgi:peptide deformylase
MLLKIVQAGDPVLRTPARPLKTEEIRSAEVQQLIELMRETMRDAPGVGLAAPQIGLGLQLAVIEDVGEVEATERKPVPFHVVINPQITLGDERVDFFEGCLSVDGYQAVVRRARTVQVTARDHQGESITIDASGWYARILQHEIDHLHGTLYIDRMRSRTFGTSRNVARFVPGVPISDLLAGLGEKD